LVRRGRQPLGATAVAALLVVVVGAAPAFANRVSAATAFYNRVDPAELAAVQWLGEQAGAVLIAPSDADFYDGTTISWLTQGIARRKAFTATEGYRNLFVRDRRDSDDAAAILAGTQVTTRANVMVASDAATGDDLVLGRVDDAWYPVAELTQTRGTDGRATLEIVGRDEVRIALAARSRLTVRSAPWTEFAPHERSQDLVTFAERGGARSFTVRSSGLLESPGSGIDLFARDAPVEATLSLQGFDAERVPNRDHEVAALLARHKIRLIWTSRDSVLQRAFERRGYATGYENAEVVIFRVPTART
jgi:hypothetical protein